MRRYLVPLLAASAAGAQAPAPCASPPAAAAVRDHAVYLAARPVVNGEVVRRRVDGDARAPLAMLLNLVGTNLEMPAALRFVAGPGVTYTTTYRGRGGGDDPLVWPVVRSGLRLTLRAGRGPGDAALHGSPFPELDSALVRALRASGGDDGLGAILRPGEVPGDTLPVALELFTGGDTAGVTAHVAQVALPHFVSTPARPLPGNALPRYPAEARRDGREGSVLVRFAVTEEGRADFASAQVLRGDREFVTAALVALPSMRFTPAAIAGCPVRVLVQQPFEFRLGPGERGSRPATRVP